MGKSRVLIAGGAGFIGSHLCEAYLKKGWEVLCLDNFSTGSKDYLSRILSHFNFEVLRHDLIEPVRAEVELIVNCTMPPDPQTYGAQPIQTLKTAFQGSLHLLGLAKRTGARYVLASSGAVYGSGSAGLLAESSWGQVNPLAVDGSFVEGLRIAETLATEYHRMHNVDSRIARIFPTYGPRMPEIEESLVGQLIHQAVLGSDLLLYGDGSESYSLCYIEDLVKGLVALGELDDFNGAINLGSDQAWPAASIAEKVLEWTGSRSQIVYQRREEDAYAHTPLRPDLSLARHTLGFETSTSLEAGLKKTVQYYKDTLLENPLA